MRILFLGTPQFAVPSLQLLADKIVGVVTQKNRPAGRCLKITPPPVFLSAQRYNIPIYQPSKVSTPEFLSVLKSISPDLIVVVAFGEILSREALEIPKAGCINLHPSLLPKYRGAAPVTWALVNGENVTGVTTFWISERMDSGDIIFQKEVEILPDDTRGTLELRLAEEGARLLAETIANGLDKRRKQDDSKATYAPTIKKEDGRIDWNETATRIHNKIRAMNPWPSAFTFMDGQRIELWKSKVVDGKGKPGSIVFLNEEGIGIGTGGGVLLIKELQAEGKKRIQAVEFVHGYRINEGMSFDG